MTIHFPFSQPGRRHSFVVPVQSVSLTHIGVPLLLADELDDAVDDVCPVLLDVLELLTESEELLEPVVPPVPPAPPKQAC